MKLKLVALGVFLISLSSCFDVYDTFNINEDGSGLYEVKMDMSRSLGLLAMMKQGAPSSNKPEVEMDTTIYYSSIVDTSTTLSPEEKIAFRKAYSTVHMDEADGEMEFHMYFPFANSKEFDMIQKTMNKGGAQSMMGALGSVLKSQMPPTPDGMGMDMPQGGANPGGSLPTSDFNYTLSPTSLSRSVKPQTKAADVNPAEDQMPEGMKEMMKINIVTTVNLPRAAKTWKGNNPTASDDKKQIKFSKSMSLEAKPTPEDFNFSIDY